MFSRDLSNAAAVIREAGVVAYPTEAVYGLGCAPMQPAAIDKLLRIKRRSPERGLILIADDFRALAPYCGELDEAMKRRIASDWPGPHTWLLPATPLAHGVNGGRETVAVRVTAHPVAAALCRACGHALVSTSANLSGRAAARTVAGVAAAVGDGPDFILPGAVGGRARPTAIRDVRDGRVIRAA